MTVTGASAEMEQAFRKRGYRWVAGVDEAGRGPLAGPVVAAAVILPDDVVIEGVDDSKKLSPDRRTELAEAIRSAAVAYAVGIAGQDEIDTINILRATHAAMVRAVDGLRQRPDMLLIDGNSFPGHRVPHTTVVGGDATCACIAAASIIAKVTRDALMDEYDTRYPEYGFRRNKGYGTPEHIRAIRMHGLSPVHRRSFRVQQELFEQGSEGEKV